MKGAPGLPARLFCVSDLAVISRRATKCPPVARAQTVLFFRYTSVIDRPNAIAFGQVATRT